MDGAQRAVIISECKCESCLEKKSCDLVDGESFTKETKGR